MNVEIGTETSIFLFWEYLLRNLGILSLQCSADNTPGFLFNSRIIVIVMSKLCNAKLGPIGPEHTHITTTKIPALLLRLITIQGDKSIFLKNIKIQIRHVYIGKLSDKFCFEYMCLCFIYVKVFGSIKISYPI
jgi:hypothetical protein